jgi:WD40 repeat protein
MPRLIQAKAEIVPTPPSLFDLAGRMIDLDAPASFMAFSGDRLMIATGAGTMQAEGLDGTEWVRPVHEGGVLCAALAEHGASLVSGGDDGCLRLTRSNGATSLLHRGDRWIDAVACSSTGFVAWTSGKQLYLATLGSDGPFRQLELGSTCRSLAFDVAGTKLAVAQYSGVLIVDLDEPSSNGRRLEWAGAHLAVAWSPDGRFVVSSMLENELHVWRVENPSDEEPVHGRMAGYNLRPLSLAWTGDGRLVTSGADCVVLWPFDGPKGPVGRAPEVFGQSPAPVKCVACHPSGVVVALGYSDGAISLASLKQEDLVMIRYPDGHPISAVAFNEDGDRLGFASDDGQAGIADLEGMSA